MGLYVFKSHIKAPCCLLSWYFARYSQISKVLNFNDVEPLTSHQGGGEVIPLNIFFLENCPHSIPFFKFPCYFSGPKVKSQTSHMITPITQLLNQLGPLCKRIYVTKRFLFSGNVRTRSAIDNSSMLKICVARCIIRTCIINHSDWRVGTSIPD